MVRILSFCFILTALTLSGCGNEDPYAEFYADYIGKPLPAINLQTLDGYAVPLADLASGQTPAIINVWATWCTPCLKELPSLFNLFKSEQVSVLTIAVDKEAYEAQAYLAQHNLKDLPVLWDPLGKQTRAAWKANQLPVTYILDAQGIVRSVEAGERVWDHPKMFEKITQLTAAK
jgi:thiol-disulfide isomerase/thioredoxin